MRFLVITIYLATSNNDRYHCGTFCFQSSCSNEFGLSSFSEAFERWNLELFKFRVVQAGQEQNIFWFIPVSSICLGEMVARMSRCIAPNVFGPHSYLSIEQKLENILK